MAGGKASVEAEDFTQKIPLDILRLILAKLPLHDILSARGVDRRWYQATKNSSPEFWRSYFCVSQEETLALKQAQLAQLDAELQAVAPGMPFYQDNPVMLREINAIQACYELSQAQLYAGLARVSQAINALENEFASKNLLFTFMLNYLCERGVPKDFDRVISDVNHLIQSDCGFAIGILGLCAKHLSPQYFQELKQHLQRIAAELCIGLPDAMIAAMAYVTLDFTPENLLNELVCRKSLTLFVQKLAGFTDLEKKAIRCLSQAFKGKLPRYVSAFAFIHRDEFQFVDSFEAVARRFASKSWYVYLIDRLALLSHQDPVKFSHIVEMMDPQDPTATKAALYGLLPERFCDFFQAIKLVAEHCGLAREELVEEYLERYLELSEHLYRDEAALIPSFFDGAMSFLAFSDQDWLACGEIIRDKYLNFALDNVPQKEQFFFFIGLYFHSVEKPFRDYATRERLFDVRMLACYDQMMGYIQRDASLSHN